LFLGMFFILGWAVWSYVSSPLLAHLTQRKDMPLHLIIATEPAMQVSYNPVLKKAVVTISAKKCDSTKIRTCFSGVSSGFFVPKQTEQDLLWQDFEYFLSHWRYNPLLLARAVAAYIKARFQKRTDLHLAEFLALSLELSQMQINDFTLTFPPQSKTKKSHKQAPLIPFSADTLLSEAENTAPLKLEILNASGRKGLAKELTYYLRRQYDKGLLNVDVMQYDNYRTNLDKTEIIDYSGRLLQVSKLSHAIGFKGTPKVEKSPTNIYDTRIILGKDFEMPL